ncbi:acyl-CoA thioesterase [Chitinophaga cymbidii]|uniref:Acyl-CoA thioesterase n=2 Tax=Chitinophaga cymbidii TaxID=1096750 RepID=A0A512RGB1_9BACT|nr:acyl-CoA thioesterase [Chitinophaga cymbidii]
MAMEHPGRSGLANFFTKMNAGGNVKIAYFGGSITEAGNGWRDQSFNWLQSKYPAVTLSQVNAGIGGTGSDLGVFRLQKDVLSKNPDLVFVEFAVNDNALPAQVIHKTMEGIVRQIWTADEQTDICFVYTVTEGTAPTLVNGQLTGAMQAMEDVAAHYGIPSVQMCDSVIQLYKAGSLIFKGVPADHPDKIVFSKDGTHPYPETGHRLYAATLAQALDSFAQITTLPTSRLVAALDADNWEDAKMIPANELTYNGTWTAITTGDTIIPGHLLNKFPNLMRGDSTQAPAATIQYQGSLAGLYDVVGPGCGQLEIYVDGTLLAKKKRFDKYSTYYRPQYFYYKDIAQGSHTIEFRVSSEPFDKMAILAQGNNEVGDTSRYGTYSCYIGYLLLRGQVQE